MSGISEDKIATIVDRVVHRLNANEPARRPAPATVAPSGECGPKRTSPSRFDDAPIRTPQRVSRVVPSWLGLVRSTKR